MYCIALDGIRVDCGFFNTQHLPLGVRRAASNSGHFSSHALALPFH
jgi:hypothetical protein